MTGPSTNYSSRRIGGLSLGDEDQTTKGLAGGGGGRSSGAWEPSLRDSRTGSDRGAGASCDSERGADSRSPSDGTPFVIRAWNSRSSADASRAPAKSP